MAPTYVTICGVKPGEGVVLNRDRKGKQDGEAVAASLADGAVVQAGDFANSAGGQSVRDFTV